jgi:hypothetical protein
MQIKTRQTNLNLTEIEKPSWTRSLGRSQDIGGGPGNTDSSRLGSNSMSLRNLTIATTLAALTALGGWFSPAAHAAKVKDCGTTTTTTTSPVTSPPSENAGFTRTSTTTSSTTQTSACHSSSDTGQQTTTTSSTGPTTNKGGGTPGGH